MNETLGSHSDTPEDHEEGEPNPRLKSFQENIRWHLMMGLVLFPTGTKRLPHFEQRIRDKENGESDFVLRIRNTYSLRQTI
jgi:hypothetical protein